MRKKNNNKKAIVLISVLLLMISLIGCEINKREANFIDEYVALKDEVILADDSTVKISITNMVFLSGTQQGPGVGYVCKIKNKIDKPLKIAIKDSFVNNEKSDLQFDVENIEKNESRDDVYIYIPEIEKVDELNNLTGTITISIQDRIKKNKNYEFEINNDYTNYKDINYDYVSEAYYEVPYTIVDNQIVRIIIQGKNYKKEKGHNPVVSYICSVENKSAKPIDVYTKNTSVNGKDILLDYKYSIKSQELLIKEMVVVGINSLDELKYITGTFCVNSDNKMEYFPFELENIKEENKYFISNYFLGFNILIVLLIVVYRLIKIRRNKSKLIIKDVINKEVLVGILICIMYSLSKNNLVSLALIQILFLIIYIYMLKTIK